MSLVKLLHQPHIWKLMSSMNTMHFMSCFTLLLVSLLSDSNIILDGNWVLQEFMQVVSVLMVKSSNWSILAVQLLFKSDKHIRDKISHWNIAVQEWLRKCIYQRSPFKGRGMSQLWVFMVSAFWHGFYAGYYVSFFLWFVQVYTQGEIFRFVKHETSRLRKFYKRLGFGGNLILTFIVNLIFSHNASFFILLDYKLSFRLLEKVNYIPQTILITLAITFTLLNMFRSKKPRKDSLHTKSHAVV